MTSKEGRSSSASGSSQLQGSGKKSKRFLGQEDSIALALAAANTQEEKVSKLLERHHKRPQDYKTDIDKQAKVSRKSTSKAKLKETKAMIAAERARSKKERVKRKNAARQPVTDGTAPSKSDKELETRKRVSFA
jgi:hypothetical protein